MFSKFLMTACLVTVAPLIASPPRWPDTLTLQDGTTLRGLILRNTNREVTVQSEYGEFTIPKATIVRIVDVPDLGLEFTEATKVGELPPWQVIANDLRLNDQIRSLVQIPAVEVKEGTFARVPYQSFRVNKNIELNIYGDPKSPAAVELGIYGLQRSNRKLQKTLRAYLAGFLNSREEIAAIYSIPFSGGEARTSTLAFEVTPPSAPDAFGAWWVGMFNPRKLEEVRLSDAQYESLTRPAAEVLGRGGKIKSTDWSPAEFEMTRREAEDDEILPRGFYRDKKGFFHVITNPLK